MSRELIIEPIDGYKFSRITGLEDWDYAKCVKCPAHIVHECWGGAFEVKPGNARIAWVATPEDILVIENEGLCLNEG